MSRVSVSLCAVVVVIMTMSACVVVNAQTIDDASGSTASQGVAQIQKYYEFLRQSDDSIFAGSVMSMDSTRLIDEATVAMGTQNTIDNLPNWLGTSVRMNTVSELLVGVCALKLVGETQLPSVDAAIPSKYLPRGVSFFNPAHPGTPLTIRQLMQHTSTLSDSKFATFKKIQPDTVMDLRSFVEGYFLVSSGGQFSVAPDVWSASKPGLDTSFKYARVNVALLAFIIEQVVVEKPSLVASTSKTYMAYAQEQILSKLGMSGTWVKTQNGGNPTLSYPAGGDIFGNKATMDYTSAGTPTTSTGIHPAYPSDYMYMTNVEDLSKLTRALFLDEKGIYRTIGAQMQSTTAFAVGSTGTSSTTGFRGQSKQGQSLMHFDGALMCAQALSSTIIEKCPLTESSNVWGHMGVGSHSMVAVFCTDTAATTNPTCVSVTLAFYDSGSTYKSYDLVLGMGAVAFQQSIGDKSSTTQTSGDEDDTKYYGLWVFFGVVAIVTFVLMASYFTEYLIQPAPISAGVAMPTAVPGMNPENYYQGK